MLKAVIFDIDGTLIDSNDFHAHSWERAFAANGKVIPFEQIRLHIGEGADQLMPHFLNHSELQKLGPTIQRRCKQIFERDYLGKVRPFPKVRELFQRLHARHIRIALASSSDEKQVRQYLRIADIEDLVDQATSADDAEKSKPNPGILEAALQSLGNPSRKETTMIGDAPYDVLAAGKADLRIAGVLCGGFTAHQLEMQGCKETYRAPAELLEKFNHVFLMA